jgi:hypothetical protein
LALYPPRKETEVMLTLSVKTKMAAPEAFGRTLDHFTSNLGLRAVELAAHLHGTEGFTEIRLSGDALVGRQRLNPRQVLEELSALVEDKYGLEPVHYLLHMHSHPDESVGHLVVKIVTGPPVELEFTSEEYDGPVREFAESLPAKLK